MSGHGAVIVARHGRFGQQSAQGFDVLDIFHVCSSKTGIRGMNPESAFVIAQFQQCVRAAMTQDNRPIGFVEIRAFWIQSAFEQANASIQRQGRRNLVVDRIPDNDCGRVHCFCLEVLEHDVDSAGVREKHVLVVDHIPHKRHGILFRVVVLPGSLRQHTRLISPIHHNKMQEIVVNFQDCSGEKIRNDYAQLCRVIRQFDDDAAEDTDKVVDPFQLTNITIQDWNQIQSILDTLRNNDETLTADTIRKHINDADMTWLSKIIPTPKLAALALSTAHYLQMDELYVLLMRYYLYLQHTVLTQTSRKRNSIDSDSDCRKRKRCVVNT